MHELRGVEVFRTGTHTDSSGATDTWTLADLEKIRDQYGPKTQEAPAVLGHPKGGAPAYGWVQSLKVEGDRLLADFHQCPSEFVEALKAGRFKKRSISVRDHQLRHVAFLGAQIPAVSGLKDVAFAEGEPGQEYTFSQGAEAPENLMEDPTMKTELEKLLAAINELRTEVATLKSGQPGSDFSQRIGAIETQAKQVVEDAQAKTKAAEAAQEKAEKSLAEFQADQGKKDREVRFAALVAKDLITPGEKDQVLSLAEALSESKRPMEFAQGDGKPKQVTAEEAFWLRLEANKAQGLLAEYSAPSGGQQEKTINTADLANKV